MTERLKFIRALRREPITGHVPHFELVFFLTMESIGKVHPSHRHYSQWNQMSAKEKRLQIEDMASCYIDIAEKYNHSAIFVHPNPGDFDNIIRLLETIREKSGDKYFLMMHGDATYSMPSGDDMIDFSAQLYEEPEKMKREADINVDSALVIGERMSKHPGLLDGYALCCDYCFNVNPFFSPGMFSDFVAPYLARLIKGYRDMGLFTIKHTDGNIMPILDQLIECKPDALHSLDPQGGVDLAVVKRLYGDKVCLIGNVNCGLLQTGSEEEVIKDVRRALTEGMPGFGYIFSTSNCAYTGLALERYELMHRIWREEGIYSSQGGIQL